MHDDLTTLSNEELRERYARVERVMTEEAIREAHAIYREWVRRNDEGRTD